MTGILEPQLILFIVNCIICQVTIWYNTTATNSVST